MSVKNVFVGFGMDPSRVSERWKRYYFCLPTVSVVFVCVCVDNRIKNCDKTLLAFMRLMKVIAAGNNNVLVGACLLEFTCTS